MKRLFSLLCAIVAFVSCDNKFEDVGNTIQRVSTLPTLTAEFAEEDTRTYVEDNSYLRWHEGDLISAFVGNTRNSKYIFDGKTGDNSGEFEPVSSNSSGEVYDLNRNYALYPYDEDALATDDPFICCSLPAVQEYAENSFGKGANTMVAVTKDVDDTFLAFKNACGYLKIKLYGNATVESIELKGNNGEKIAGNASITATYGGVPTVAMAEDATDSITLDCGEGVKLSTDAEKPTEFWFVVPPTEFSEGLTIVATDTNGVTFVKSTSNAVTITRNEIQPMAALEAIFRDPNKPAYNEIWYTSSDGNIVEPSRTNAFGANIVSNSYKDGKGVITFDGDITTIGYEAFSGCTSLTSVTIPDSVTTIGSYAFYKCDNLTNVTIPDSVTTIGNAAFYDCYSLTSVTIPDSVTKIDGSAFSACKSLTSIIIPDGVTTISKGIFQYCENLTSVTIPDSVTTIGHYAFGDCSSLTSVTIPDSVTSIGERAFVRCTSLESIYCKATTPPSLGSNAFDDYNKYYKPIGCSIYVPQGCLSAYKPATGWSDYAQYIIEYDFEGGEVMLNNKIYYTSSDGKIVEPYIGPDPNFPSETVDVKRSFGANIISNTYENGKGVITFDGDVTTIGTRAFYNCDNLSSITIPIGVTEIGYCAFEGCTNLTKVINESTYFSRIQQTPFNNCPNLKTFEGKLASEDGRCLVSEDGVLLTCATAGLTEYTLPNNVKEVEKYALQLQNDIQKLTIPEGVTKLGGLAFANSDSLTEVTIPKSVTDIEGFTFDGCKNLSKIHIHNDIIGEYEFSSCWSLTDIIIPDNVTIIEKGGFGNCQGVKSVTFHNNLKAIGEKAFYNCALTSVTIPESVETIGDAPFWGCENLMEFNGKFATGDKICLIANGRLIQVADGIFKELSDYTIPAEVTHIGDSVFSNSSNLNSITIPEGVVDIGICAFGSCTNLREITIPSTVTDIGIQAFFGCDKLSAIYFRGATPPNVYEGEHNHGKKIAEDGTIIRVPDEYIDNYKNSLWGDYYTILGYNEDLYSSTDYSEDGKVTLLNRATKGNGIDIVIMGDAYSDRQIAAGDYSADINKAIEALFSEEPYKSFRDYFNVYMVTVVSPYDGYFIGITALGGYFGSETLVGGNHSSVINYAQKAISDDRMDDAMLVVIMNREYYAGTCYMYSPGGTSDYGRGLSISYFPLGTDDSMFAGLIRHETGGHGFAKLGDEYYYSYMGRIPENEIESYKRQRQNWGWWKNVDFTSDTSAVRWSHFINDNRYANEGLGAFEGGLTYLSGVWRPTENSIMRHNTGGFNAPSREAIYYRIHKLAYGDSWEYDYEKFVEWDKSKGTAASKASSWHAPLKYPHTTPPVVVGHSWRDAK